MFCSLWISVYSIVILEEGKKKISGIADISDE